MLTVREVAEVICRWEGESQGLDPDRMELKMQVYAIDPVTVVYYGNWDYSTALTTVKSLGHFLVTDTPQETQIVVTPEDIEAMLEMTGIANTWVVLVPKSGTSYFKPLHGGSKSP